jgi:tetratricopeptide (TPR) repeat protein
MGQTYWEYLWSLVTGRGLTPLHSISQPHFFSGLAFYGALAASVWYFWQRKDHVMLRLGFVFFLLLLPVSNLVPIAVLRADRYLYIGVAVFFLALFIALDRLWEKMTIPWPEKSVWIFGPMAILCYLPATAHYLPVYQDANTMWSHVAKDPQLTGVASYNLGVVAEKDGNISSAMMWYQKAIETTGHCRASNNMATLLFEQGMGEKAHPLFLEAVRRCPEDPGLLFNLGVSYLAKNDMENGRSTLVKVVNESAAPPNLVKRAETILHEIAGTNHVVRCRLNNQAQ